MKKLIAAIFTVILLAGISRADAPDAKTLIDKGIKAEIKVIAKDGTIDVIISDSKTNKIILKADVALIVILPSGKSVKKELAGMNMGDMFSYMNSVDMKEKGVYSFTIDVKIEGKHARFVFKKEVK